MSEYQGRNNHILKSGSVIFGSSYQMRRIVIRDGMSFIGVCLSIAGLGVLGYQCLLWLNYGIWPPLTFRLVLELIGAREPVFTWRGVEKVSAWMFDLPLSGALIASGLVAATFGVAVTIDGRARGSLSERVWRRRRSGWAASK